jgi:hypothetical protein
MFDVYMFLIRHLYIYLSSYLSIDIDLYIETRSRKQVSTRPSTTVGHVDRAEVNKATTAPTPAGLGYAFGFNLVAAVRAMW